MTINVLVLIFGAFLFNAYNGCQARSCSLSQQDSTYLEEAKELSQQGLISKNQIQPKLYFNNLISGLDIGGAVEIHSDQVLYFKPHVKTSKYFNTITARGPPLQA